MQDNEKNKLYQDAKEHVDGVIDVIKKEKKLTEENINKIETRLKSFSAADRIVEREVLTHSLARLEELDHLAESPYFARCDILFSDETELKKIFFGKFQISEQNIYSWISPVAAMRFENIGDAAYILPDGRKRAGDINRNDQFLIANGKIIFMASQAKEWQRTLIYQEYLTNRKSGFILPEIIERLEKAQDAVIRASHAGSFLIAGPAGSGKTTLAFHRIAYLTQSPDTAPLYPDYNIIVFVQDESTKKYFSALLPQLGVKNVIISTWPEWALSLLGLADYKYVFRYGQTEADRDEYEFYKHQALSRIFGLKYEKNIIKILKQAYSTALSDKYKKIFSRQIDQKLLDIFDLTILLKTKLCFEKNLYLEKTVIFEDKRGGLKTAKKMMPIKYSLIVIDEAENYLAEQIKIIQSCVNSHKSILYVGDLAQQTRWGTIKNWDQAGEDFSLGRKVVLDKIYRNTKQILHYIKACGYNIKIPAGLTEGQRVVEVVANSQADEAEFISQAIKENPNSIIGILRSEKPATVNYKKMYSKNKNIHVLSVYEAQGVEFDVVILLKTAGQANYDNYPLELAKQKHKVNRDLQYVALTRAMSKLYVIKINF